jgi:hypothetical protein
MLQHFRWLFPILRQPAAFPEPGKGSFDNPSVWQNLEPLGCVGALYNLDDPTANAGQSIAQFWSLSGQLKEHLRCAITVLNTGTITAVEMATLLSSRIIEKSY